MIADSSFLVALFHQDDEFHARAVSEMASSDATITVSDRIAEEVLTVFSYRNGWDYALSILAKIRSNRRFEIRRLSEEDWERIIGMSASIGKKISFADYVVLYLSSAEGSLPLTYDQQLLKITKGRK